jgi:hypothetical protein
LPTGYKLRLADGSEIGPMDLDGVKDWYRKGLVKPNDLVLRPGAKRWVPLSRVINLRERPTARASPASASDDLRAAVREATVRTRQPKAARGTVRRGAAGEVQPWRSSVAGVLLLLTGAASAFFVLVPERWIAALDPMPWREVAMGQAALGLLLIRGWELGRKIARLVLLLVAFTLFPAAGMLLGQRAPWPAFVVVASGLAFLAGLVAWLARGRQPAVRLASPCRCSSSSREWQASSVLGWWPSTPTRSGSASWLCRTAGSTMRPSACRWRCRSPGSRSRTDRTWSPLTRARDSR